MATYSKHIECPECKAECKALFRFYDADDGDTELQALTCECGCDFDAECSISVYVDYYVGSPTIINSGIKKPVFDINDTSTWPETNDPNQLSLI